MKKRTFLQKTPAGSFEKHETGNKQDGGVIMSNNMGMTVYSHIAICNMYVYINKYI